MARKPRDYAAEYAARMKRGEMLGLSKSAARGRPQEGELSARELRSFFSAVQSDNRQTRDQAREWLHDRFSTFQEYADAMEAYAEAADLDLDEIYTLWFS